MPVQGMNNLPHSSQNRSPLKKEVEAALHKGVLTKYNIRTLCVKDV